MLLLDLVRGVRDTDLQNFLLYAIVIQHFLTKQGKQINGGFCSILLQWNPINTDTEGAIESVHIKRVEFREAVRTRDKENCP